MEKKSNKKTTIRSVITMLFIILANGLIAGILIQGFLYAK